MDSGPHGEENPVDPTTQAAVDQYRAVEYRRQQLQRNEARLHASVERLTPDQFAVYAAATAEVDRQRDEREAKWAERRQAAGR
jgi:hypothetical protein